MAMMALSLLLLGTFILVTINLYGFIREIRARVELRVYLSDETDDRTVERLKDTLEGIEGVLRVDYVDKEGAAAEFQAEFGDSLLDALSWNPLPRSLRVEMQENFRTSGYLQEIAERIDGEEGVEEVDYAREWLDRLDRGVWILIVVDMLLTAVLSAGCVSAAFNAVGLMMLTRREAIEIMRLVGATRGFILRPFLLEGVLQGTAGGAIAALCVYGTSRWVVALLADLSLQWSGHVACALIPLGAGLGIFGAAMAVHALLEKLP